MKTLYFSIVLVLSSIVLAQENNNQLIMELADKKLKINAARKIGQLGPPAKSYVANLITAFEDTDEGMRMNVLWALGEIGSKKVIPTVEKALQDDSVYVRNAASLALKKLQGKKQDINDPLHIEVLRKWLLVSHKNDLALTVKDLKPYIVINFPQNSYIHMLPATTLRIDFKAKDDFGLIELAIMYRTKSSQNWTTKVFYSDTKSQYPPKKLTTSYTLKFEEIVAKPLVKGDYLFFKIRAKDNSVSRPGIKETEIYTVEIINRANLKDKIDKRLLKIKGWLAEIVKRQEEKKNRLTDLLFVIDKIEVDDLAQVLQLHIAQHNIAQDIRAINKKLEAIIRNASDNRIWDPHMQNRIEKIAILLKGFFQKGKSAYIGKMLLDGYNALLKNKSSGHEYLKKALKGQGETISTLAEAIEMLEQWDDFNEVLEDIGKLIDEIDKNKKLMDMLKDKKE